RLWCATAGARGDSRPGRALSEVRRNAKVSRRACAREAFLRDRTKRGWLLHRAEESLFERACRGRIGGKRTSPPRSQEAAEAAVNGGRRTSAKAGAARVVVASEYALSAARGGVHGADGSARDRILDPYGPGSGLLLHPDLRCRFARRDADGLPRRAGHLTAGRVDHPV